MGAKGEKINLSHNAFAKLTFFSLLIAFLYLGSRFAVSDFSYNLVFMHSNTLKPMLYKITGMWGNHEGSMLLFTIILSGYSFVYTRLGKAELKDDVLGYQAFVTFLILVYTYFTSNPFAPIAAEYAGVTNGMGLNPLLQDIGLAMHPPFLYLGYAGSSIAFSMALAVLKNKITHKSWSENARHWILFAWILQAIGIAMGSWWAYRELGWGGFWFWDPVENASFMPWLIATALLHSAIVVEKRESLKAWTILLAILAFGFSLVGTFIVRSGVITSVHAFASDPTRGMFVLAILAVFVGGALTLFALRAGALEAKGVFAMVSRETGLVVNNLLLTVACFVVFIGTIWPLVAEILWNRALSVGAPFFNAAFMPFAIALAIVLPIGAVLPWKRADLGRAMKPFAGALALTVAAALLAYAVTGGVSTLGPLGVALAVWLVVGVVVDLWQRCGRGAFGQRLARLMRLPRADWGRAM
jgi:cytochrome c-type biogenesis protein CcmF